jgi:tetratricopeptide (TPR) repeat protein
LAAELSLTRRVRLHARIAETLEEMYQPDIERHASELALHFTQAETMLGTDRLVKYSLMAGDTALGNLAFEDALKQFERVLSAMEEQPDTIETADALAGLGRAQSAILSAGQFPAVLETLIRACDIYVEHRESDKAIDVAQIHLNAAPGMLSAAEKMVSRALTLAPAGSKQEGRLQSRYGFVLGFELGDFEGAERAFSRALDIADAQDDTDQKLLTLSLAPQACRIHMKFREALGYNLRAIELLNSIPENLFASSIVHRQNALLYTELGESDKAREHAVITLELSERLRRRADVVDSLSSTVNLATTVGDWDWALADFDQALLMAPRDMRHLARRAKLSAQLGNMDEARSFLERMITTLEDWHRRRARLGFVSHAGGLIGYISDDRALAESVKKWSEESLNVGNSIAFRFAHTNVGLALATVIAPPHEYAQQTYDALRPYAGISFETTQIDWVLGLLAKCMGRLEDATGHFEDSLAFCRKADYRPSLAWTLHDYAAMLLERDDPGDQEKATAMLDESLQISTDLSMRPLMERALSKRDILKA